MPFAITRSTSRMLRQGALRSTIGFARIANQSRSSIRSTTISSTPRDHDTFTSSWPTFSNARRKGLRSIESQMRATSTMAGGSGSSSHEHTNGLAHATSPYLLQHAHNPVNWVPWSQEAIETAKREDKMIFLSSGYASCHWCHVMAHESFEDQEVASIMNENLVCIKLDREERPDVDAAYMTFIQATSGRGGWPMSVFLTPEGEPIFGGTYFPKEAFLSLIEKLMDIWTTRRQDCISSAKDIASQLRDVTRNGMEGDGAKTLPPLSLVAKATRHWLLTHDTKNGGFGNAPKFPSPPNTFHLLHRIASETGAVRSQRVGERRSDVKVAGALEEAGLSADIGAHALQASAFTLARIARGGISDHLGGGIARYSVDEEWRVPHFEKMLYDQGQLLTAFAEAIQLSRDDDDAKQYILEYEAAIAGIVKYLSRDITHPDGAIFAAEDADSLPNPQASHAKEGAFYVWDDAEVREVLGGGNANSYKLIKAHFGLEADGNIPASSDPHGDLAGKNMLHASKSLASTASALGFDNDQAQELWTEARDKLLKRRNGRSRPGLDDKVITSWNGLAISGLAKAARVLDSSNPVARQAQTMAERASDFIWKTMWDSEAGQLLRSWRNGTRGPWGFDVDYAFVVQAMLDLYEATWDGKCIDRALTFQAAQETLFWDHDGPGGYLMSPPESDGNVLGRQRGDQEGAEPTSTSVSAHNLLRLQALLSDVDAALKEAASSRMPMPDTLPPVAERIRRCITSGGMVLSRAPHALGTRLTALLDARAGATSGGSGDRQLIIVGAFDAPETQALLDVVRTHLIPRVHTVYIDSSEKSDATSSNDQYMPRLGKALQAHNEAVTSMLSDSGNSTPYATVCTNFACGLPLRRPADMLEALQQ